ncbi:MAG: HAMP domain-containing histidine kinase [Anaerolineales bacterium]|nr:MAG: HAMP domain-containing histidine kinase [Anaerolineales bacterium]
MPYIFQPFYGVDPARNSDQGRVGLGLALTYELLYLLGGSIEVASEPGVGTTFILKLPTEPERQRQAGADGGTSGEGAGER